MAGPQTMKPPRTPEDSRMTLGEHLEELRWCLLRGIIALVLSALICIWPAKYVLEVLVRPAVLVLQAHGQPASLLATSPVETLAVYIKVVLISALILAGPYVLYQFWTFVAAGLYRHEQKWVRRLVPVSVALFLTGVVFMYLFVLILSLNFLVGVSDWLPLPQPQPGAFERSVLHLPGAEAATSQPTTAADWPRIPLLAQDPSSPPAGAMWFNVTDNRLKVHEKSPHEERTYSYQFQRDDKRAMVTNQYKIGEYLTFVLVLTIAFGVAFQLPLVVIFLARSGLVPVKTFRRYRKVVILVIVFIAGVLAPPDLLSHLMLSGPMLLLFEIGLFLAARHKAKPKPAAAT
jgi:Tat protein translocase TatC